MMEGVNAALDSRANTHFGVDVARERALRNQAFAHGDGQTGNTTEVNVTVESRTEDPLLEGTRFAKDIAFGLGGL